MQQQHSQTMNNSKLMPSPASTNCRRSAMPDRGGVAGQLGHKKSKLAHGNRLEIRRLKSLCQSTNDFTGEDLYSSHRKCIEVPSDQQRSEMSMSYQSSPPACSSSDHSSDNDAGASGISSFRHELNTTGREGLSGGGVTCPAHGSMSVMGRRREMEDAVTVEEGLITACSRKYHFYGVYDGHGGSRVAHACRDRLHRLLVKEVEEEEREVDWEKMMVSSFGKMDREVIDSGVISGSIGSTAVVAVVGEEQVVVANCGDSRAVLSRGGVAVPMSSDHKPDRPDELERIEVSGGRVINWNGQRVLGVLATSRSIGDEYLKPFVISRPEVIVSPRTNIDEFLILASDGLWDVISNEVACQVVRRCLEGRMRRRRRRRSHGMGDDERSDERVVNERRTAEAAAVLAELAMARGSKDNISVIVVEL